MWDSIQMSCHSATITQSIAAHFTSHSPRSRTCRHFVIFVAVILVPCLYIDMLDGARTYLLNIVFRYPCHDQEAPTHLQEECLVDGMEQHSGKSSSTLIMKTLSAITCLHRIQSIYLSHKVLGRQTHVDKLGMQSYPFRTRVKYSFVTPLL